MTRAAAIAAYLAALLAVDRSVDLRGQLVLGALTWVVLVVAARPLPAERRAQVAARAAKNARVSVRYQLSSPPSLRST